MGSRVYLFILCFFVLAGCTAPARLVRKFSEKPAGVVKRLHGESYANAPLEMPGRHTVARYTLWNVLAAYRPGQDTLPSIPDHAIVRLALRENNALAVSAHCGDQTIAGFDIPVRKRDKYLILEKERRMIPIPVIYFNIQEEIAILSPLENNRLGFHRYSDETLWILFFGASKTGRSIEEYMRVDDGG